MSGRRPQRSRRGPARRRGFTLIEVMISMSILAVGLLGVLQMQVLASAQNGIARRTMQAAAILRDFQETVRSVPWQDARFTPSAGCLKLSEVAELHEDGIGNRAAPSAPFHYTALNGDDPNAASVGAVTGALGTMAGAKPYRGQAALAFLPESDGGAALGRRGYQLAWNVTGIDTNGDGQDDCEARLIQFVVRFQVGQSDRWRSYVGHVMQYNPEIILPGGMFDSSRMEAW